MAKRKNPGPPPSVRKGRVTMVEEGRAAAAVDELGEEPGSVLYVGVRVGNSRSIPPGYQPLPCAECGRPTWTSGEMIAHTGDRGRELVVLCMECGGVNLP